MATHSSLVLTRGTQILFILLGGTWAEERLGTPVVSLLFFLYNKRLVSTPSMIILHEIILFQGYL